MLRLSKPIAAQCRASLALSEVKFGGENEWGSVAVVMGSFEGHALPGTFFFLFGLCHTVAIYRRYFRALYSQSSPGYLSKASLTLGRLPAEGILKLLASVAGIAAEFVTGFPPNGAAFYASNRQHITMYREGDSHQCHSLAQVRMKLRSHKKQNLELSNFKSEYEKVCLCTQP